MKRVVLSIGVATLLVSGTLFAGNEYDQSTSKEQEFSQEDLELLEQAERQYEEDLQKSHGYSRNIEKKREDKTIKTDVAALEKSRETSRYQDGVHHEIQKKALDKAAQDEVKAWKEQERRARKKQERENRKALRKEKTDTIKQKTEQRYQERLSDIRHQRATRQVLLNQWKLEHAQQQQHDRAAGRYADLYKIPAWPAAAQFFEGRGLFNTTVSYNYATDAYDSSGSNRDVTILEFGEQPIRVKDIVLASKLVSDGKLTHKEFTDNLANSIASKYLQYLADKEIKFLGKAEEYSVRFDLARYAFRNDLAIGVQVPLLYRKHRLQAHLDLPEDAFGLVDALTEGGAAEAAGRISPNAFMRRYGQSTDQFLKDIWKEKGIDTLGGSAMGLGDVTVFLHGKISSSYFDKMVIGAKVQIPFAKKTTPRKLWGPALGNDGHTEFAIFSSVLFSYRQFLNPHIFLQGLFGAPSHIDKRVPRRISATVANTENTEANLFTFSDRVEGNGDVSINEFDTAIKNLGDNVATLKITTGFEMQLRIGNVIERFMSQRGFLDMFYYFRFKATDEVRGVNLEEWNPTIFTAETQQIEHTAGIDYSYQFDHNTRLVAGLLYTFAGINVPKTFNAHVSLGFTFK